MAMVPAGPLHSLLAHVQGTPRAVPSPANCLSLLRLNTLYRNKNWPVTLK